MKDIYVNVVFNNLQDRMQLMTKSIMPSKVDSTKGSTNLNGVDYDMQMRIRNNIFGKTVYTLKIGVIRKDGKWAHNTRTEFTTLPRLRKLINSDLLHHFAQVIANSSIDKSV